MTGAILLSPKLLVAVLALERFVVLEVLVRRPRALGEETHWALATLELLLVFGPVLAVDVHPQDPVGDKILAADLAGRGGFRGHFDSTTSLAIRIARTLAMRRHVSLQRVRVFKNQVAFWTGTVICAMHILHMGLN